MKQPEQQRSHVSNSWTRWMQQVWTPEHTLQDNPHLLLPRITSEPFGNSKNPKWCSCAWGEGCVSPPSRQLITGTVTQPCTNISCIFWCDYFLHTKINTVQGKPQEKVKLNITSGFANTFLCLLIKSYPVVTTVPGRWGCWVCLHFPDTKLRMKSHWKPHHALLIFLGAQLKICSTCLHTKFSSLQDFEMLYTLVWNSHWIINTRLQCKCLKTMQELKMRSVSASLVCTLGKVTS